MQEYKQLTHTFEPIYNEKSKILILGSFPSVKSREHNFYYGHPQNRYWKVLATVLGVKVPETVDEKRKMLLDNNIAIWDVIHSCSIIGSSDTSIKDVVVNDFSEILNNSNVKTIYVNGGKAYELYHKYAEKTTGIKAIKLPSTSPANAAWSLDRLCETWKQIIDEQKGRDKMLFIEYPKCTTCKKAKKWLDDNGIEYTDRHIKEDNPTYEELKEWSETSGLPLKKFFNTSGQLYRSMELKDKLPEMTDEEKLRLLATDGMLVKRPIIVDGDTIMTGFKEAEWAEKLIK